MADDIFKYIFMNEKFCISIPISLKFVPKGPIVSIGSGNGLAPIRCQAIIWTNGSLVCWCIYALLSLNESTAGTLASYDWFKASNI